MSGHLTGIKNPLGPEEMHGCESHGQFHNPPKAVQKGVFEFVVRISSLGFSLRDTLHERRFTDFNSLLHIHYALSDPPIPLILPH
jgi:hypothetical protein